MIMILTAGIAAVIGAWARYLLIQIVDHFFGWTSLKISTMLINISGAFVLGIITTHMLSGTISYVFASGIMGGYTTFSTYLNETVQLQNESIKIGLLYFGGTLIGGLFGALIGIWL